MAVRRPRSSPARLRRQRSKACGQRGANTQPGGGRIRSGTSPGMVASSRRGALGARRIALQERPGVGVARAVEQVEHRALLDHLARIHHHHLVAELGDQAEIVRDEQDRAREARPSARASRWMIWASSVTSSAVVGSSAIRRSGPAEQRHRDRDPLAHAARELMRVVVDPARGIGDADPLQHRDRRAGASRRAPTRARGTACRSSGSRCSAPG